MSRPSGILLAGGASRRFGRPKLVEPLGGAPLFHRPLRALIDSCDDVVVVLAPDAPQPALPDGAGRVSFAHDRVTFEGPLAGARAGLERVRGDSAVLLAADMPGVTAALVRLMAAGQQTSPRPNAVVLCDAGSRRPLPAVVAVGPALALARSLLQSGERRLRALIEGLDAEELPEAVWRVADVEGEWRRDVNVPGDLPAERR